MRIFRNKLFNSDTILIGFVIILIIFIMYMIGVYIYLEFNPLHWLK